MAILSLICGMLVYVRFLESRRVEDRLNTLQTAMAQSTAQQPALALSPTQQPSSATKGLKPGLQPNYTLPDIFAFGTTAISDNGIPSSSAALPQEILPRYRTAYSENSDMVGWLKVPDTLLNLPIMHTPADGEYYLHRLFDRSNSAYGTPFLDARCTLAPRNDNLLLHGHHMRDGTMFAPLTKYEDKNFYKTHPLIQFDTLYEEGTYEILSVFRSVYDENATSPDLYYNFLNAQDAADFDHFMEDVKKRALYDTGKTATYGDALLTLITCNYHTENGRFTVVARRVNT